jgi:hypothetical protein
VFVIFDTCAVFVFCPAVLFSIKAAWFHTDRISNRIPRRHVRQGRSCTNQQPLLDASQLAISLMAGPGAITATVLLAGRASGHMLLVGLLLAVVVFVSLSGLVAFLMPQSGDDIAAVKTD